MPYHQFPEEAADKLLAGDDLPGGTGQAMVAAAAAIRRAGSPATDDELANADAAIARFVELVQPEPIAAVPPRVRRLPISAKAAAIVAVATLWSTGVAAAATGHLPGGLQRAVSNTAERVGLDVPGPKSDKAADDDEDAAATTTTATTSSSSTTAGSSTTSASSTTGSSTTAAPTTLARTQAAAAVAVTSTIASRGVGPDVAGPAQKGLCNAYLNALAKGKPKNPEAPPWRNLLAAAKEAGGTVEEFCTGGPASASTTVAAAVTTTATTTTSTTTTTAPTTTTTTTTTTVSAASAGASGNPGNGNGNANGNGNGGQGNGGGNGNGKP